MIDNQYSGTSPLVQLPESGLSFRSLWEAGPAAVAVVNRNGEIILVNTQIEQLFGYSREELLGRQIETLFAPHSRGRHPGHWAQSFHEAVVRGEASLELDGLRKDRAELPIEINLGELEREECTLLSIRDMTRRRTAENGIKHLNEDLQRRSIELEAANKELEAFTYSVSHDLRAPLRHIDGFSKLLLEEASSGLSESARGYLEDICASTREMGRLVDDLLNLARVGRKELVLQVTGLGSLVAEVVTELKRTNRGRVIEWKIGRLPFVDCDPGLMKQVFVNLLSNAVKFTSPREVAVIEVDAHSANGQTTVVIRDNGIGFNMKNAGKLFGVFQRLHRQEDFEGTGVGLATIQRIIQKHGGRVWATAELDHGATFSFSLGDSKEGASR